VVDGLCHPLAEEIDLDAATPQGLDVVVARDDGLETRPARPALSSRRAGRVSMRSTGRSDRLAMSLS
jgi:hypothetical protein